MIDYLQCSDPSDSEDLETEPPPSQLVQQLMALSVAALSTSIQAPRTLQLLVQIQGQKFLFLVDSRSSSCFIDSHKAALLIGAQLLPEPVPVKVASGLILQCVTYFPALHWSADSAEFQDTFKVLELASYDGIVGLDGLVNIVL
jgi:hypothetical protein